MIVAAQEGFVKVVYVNFRIMRNEVIYWRQVKEFKRMPEILLGLKV
jgi:hypothetical protein